MDNPHLSVLRLPTAFGFDANSVVHQPHYLRVRPNNSVNWCLITDAWGRETINGKYNKGLVDFCLPGQTNVVFRLRPKDSGFKRWINDDGHSIYVLADARGVDVATFTPVGADGKKYKIHQPEKLYEVDCVNGLSGGSNVRMSLRGSLYSPECALTLGGQPVVRVHRPQWMSADIRKVLMVNCDPKDTYDAAVAPGADLIWLSTLLWCLDFLYAKGTA